ncbi:MAG: ATP-binding cassette domain-containing protein, partial [Thioalkalivibrio sp.]
MGRLEIQELVIDVPGRVDGAALTLTVEPGQVWGVLGPNGAGKTTLLHTLAGLRAPRSGEIRVDGRLLASLGRREVARRLGLVFQ